jgi:hypothetical protein
MADSTNAVESADVVSIPIDAHKIRQQAYWSYFAGGYHTYGNSNVWNFGAYRPEVTDDWRAALESPGAQQMSVLARVFSALQWPTLEPDQAMFASGAGTGARRNVAMRSAASDRALIYFSNAGTVSVKLERLATANGTVHATWIDPRTGAVTAAGDRPASAQAFTSPSGWPDALLLLDGGAASSPSTSEGTDQ